MPLLFYGYKYLFKKNNFIVDILIFYIVIISSQTSFYLLNLVNPVNYFINYISIITIFIIFAFYLLLTLIPIKNFLFKDPITDKYGFNGHK